MEFVETPTFTRQVSSLLEEDEYRLLQVLLAAVPDAGALIRGGGGIRKLRVPLAGRGKRGGARTIYYWVEEIDRIYMLTIYPKANKDNLSAREVAILRQLVAGL